MNITEQLINELKEDSCELYYKKRDILEKITNTRKDNLKFVNIMLVSQNKKYESNIGYPNLKGKLPIYNNATIYINTKLNGDVIYGN